MTSLDFINKFLSLATIIGHLFLVFILAQWLFFRNQLIFVIKFISKNGLILAFLVSIFSTVGSLFYSNVAGFVPCELCWWQRIFMYPLVIIFIFSLAKKDARAADYALLIAVIGFLISLYHNYMYYVDQGLMTNCRILNQEVSCIKRYVFEFGYITIPMMTLTAFALIIVLLWFYKKRKQDVF